MLSVAATAAAASPAVMSSPRPGWEDYARGCVEFCGRPASEVTGRASRQASVRAALAVIPEDVRVVVVHDAARPFAAPDLFTAVIDGVDDEMSAIPVVPVTDTVKRLRDGEVTATDDRRPRGS